MTYTQKEKTKVVPMRTSVDLHERHFGDDMKVEIYSKDACSFCNAAIRLSESQGFDTTVYKLDEDYTREELFDKFPNVKSFPIILVDDKFVGGYREFANSLAADNSKLL